MNLPTTFSARQAVQNKYEPVIDTAFTVRKGSSEAHFYKTKDKFLFNGMDVSSGRFIKLCYGIDIGMDKKSFLAALGVNANTRHYADTIKVYNDELEGDFTIFFTNSKIVHLVIRDTME
jgi:hypothetical protein